MKRITMYFNIFSQLIILEKVDKLKVHISKKFLAKNFITFI